MQFGINGGAIACKRIYDEDTGGSEDGDGDCKRRLIKP